MTASARLGSRTATLVARAERLFPGGVNSPVRAFRAVGRPPLVLERGEGPYVWDADGRRYVDFIGAWGPAILGHGHPAVVGALTAAAKNGLALGATHPLEIELGEAIRAAMPSIERLRFTSSGTEAVMSAVRLARAATGRDMIVKFAGGYHGHTDGLLVEAGSGVVTHAIPGSAGVPDATAAQTTVLPYNDPTSVTLAFAANPGRIATVNGAPAKPISGTDDSRRISRMASRSGPTAASGSNSRSVSMSSGVRIGRAMTGPTPSTISRSTPMPGSGVVMSANRIAASTPSRLTGWSVTSAHRAASRVISTSVARSRIVRYSGSDRPA